MFEIKDIIQKYDNHAENIATAICKAREKQIINTTSDLKEILDGVFPNLSSGQRYNKLMKVFMALRIAVNNELIVLDQYLYKTPILDMKEDASMVILTFHSTEDQIVSNHFKRWTKLKYGKQAFKSVITPTTAELEENPASRSAKLRVFIRE
mmetsp:Transcript_29439/g.26006  ORF Transcript_29439/g.26006 Transcript_29439/m.26006 type:complete len:152 (+) Transcript_29439:509-964(+)